MVVTVLENWGGVAQRATLVKAVSRSAVDRALRRGDIVADSRGRYALPDADRALRAANGLHAVLSHRSAAAHWGWEQAGSHPIQVTVPRKRRLRRRTRVQLHYADLAPGEVDGAVTSRRRTLADCLRSCPFHEALAIADSALRNGEISPVGLAQLAHSIRGRGAPAARRVARVASPLAANPFESVLRAIALDAGLDPQPQTPVYRDDEAPELIGVVDLLERQQRLILEADSYQHHGGRAAFAKDCRRYNAFVLAGFRVLRLSWEAVMHRPEEVRELLLIATSGRRMPVLILEAA